MRDKVATFGFLAALVAGFSVFNLVVRYTEIGLSPLLAEAVKFFRTLLAWFFSWTGFFGFEVPIWYRDLFALSAVGLGVMIRGFDWNKRVAENPNNFHPVKDSSLHVFTIQLMGTAMLIGLTGWVFSLLAFTFPAGSEDRQLRREFLITLGAIIFLFATNAYGLSAI